MVLLKTGIDYLENATAFVEKSSELYIFVPFVKLEPLRELLGSSDVCKAIVVRWSFEDLKRGASDLEVYDFCLSKGITLYRNPRLHMKALVDSFESCLIGSANISARALNIPETESYNFEVGYEVDRLSIQDRYYFNVVLEHSALVDEDQYQQLKEHLEDFNEGNVEYPDFDLSINDASKSFLLSALPMSLDPETFFRVCESGQAANDIEMNCAVHDAALYEVDPSLPAADLRSLTKERFFSHPFVAEFEANLVENGFIYFGRAKEWILRNCSDVPLPRKWEITENVQILYRWFVDLGDGRYEIDVPGRRSERLRVLSSNSQLREEEL